MVLVSQQNPNERKEVRKVQPDKAVTLEDFRDEENDQALESTPCSSTRKSSKNTHKKKSVKKEDASRLIFHQNRNQIKKYGFVWFVKKSGRQTIIGGFCDLCDEPFHLQCSGIEYEQKDYYDIDIEALFFECENCTDDV